MGGYDMITEFPTGYRFMPTDVELIQHYLTKKVHCQLPLSSLAPLLQDIHANVFYSKSPDNLAKNMCEREQYFFIHEDKYFGGHTGKSQVVGNGIEGDVIGLKVNLKYFSESSKKNNWTMVKYRLTCEYDTRYAENNWIINHFEC
ncbi:hypothetical protein H5410_061909 [Solanum commersonii]|uniref:NAC domain-containing protein n=1 Tax=Solanum commersonii TaxID=4109 RepID=A0A9J5W9Z4_SOLCO|nr:hypothetical protein H5410_061909 [Solanum commersonii]